MSDRSSPILSGVSVLTFFVFLFLFLPNTAAGEEPDIRLLVRENLPRVVVRAGSMDVELSDGGRWNVLAAF